MKTRTYLNTVCSRLEKEGLSASYLICEGGIAEMILQVAGFMDADLIAMSTYGRSRTHLFLLGSVAYHVVRHSPLPSTGFAQKVKLAGSSARWNIECSSKVL